MHRYYRNEHIKPPVGNVPVPYFSKLELRNYRLRIKQGKLYDRLGRKVETGGADALYVMDGKGRFYFSVFDRADPLHHSSFLSGRPVAGAGMMRVRDGKLLWINARSGHYLPSNDILLQVERRLRELGVDDFVVLKNEY